MKPRIVILTGPTASGKTSLAIEWTRQFPVEIVNADSLQVFRMLDIGTAKPSAETFKTIPHHLIDLLNPDEEITAAWFSGKAHEAIADILSRNKIPLVVGGAGFYLKALEHPPVAVPTRIREVNEKLERTYDALKEKDPAIALKIHPNDRYRIDRAFDLLEGRMRPSEQWEAASAQTVSFESIWFGLAWEREALYDRINLRVLHMFDQGLIRETESVFQKFPDAQHRLSRAIGYRASLEVLGGRMTKKEAIERSQQETRQYAKRQLTWFRKEPRIHWLNPEHAFEKAREIFQ